METWMHDMPESVRCLVDNAPVKDCSSSPEARVLFIEREGGFYLKTAASGTLKREAEMDAFFFQKGMGPQVEGYWSEKADWLLTRKAPGTSGIDPQWLEDPRRLSALMGEELRKLHEMDTSGCPVMDHTANYLRGVEAGYRAGRFEPSDGVITGALLTRPQEAWRVFREAAGSFCTEVLLHGDFCLPNLMLKDWQLQGYIDLGQGGVGDRHVDLFWGMWTLWFNLKTHRWGQRLLDAYGREKIAPELLLAVEAAECFG